MWTNCRKKPLFWLIIFYASSRFLFLASYPHFYDEPEYLRESLKPSFAKSLSESHESIHPVSLFLNQGIQKLTVNFLGNSGWNLSLVSAIFGLLGLLSFYFLIKKLFNQKLAFYSSLPLLLFSHLWLIQTNILHEAVDQGLFLFGLLYWVNFLEKKSGQSLIISFISLSLAVINFVGILIWFPLVIAVIFLKRKYFKKENVLWGLFLILISGLLAIGVLAFLLQISGVNSAERLNHLFFIYGGGGGVQKWGIVPLLRSLRNIFLITTFGYSPLVLIVLCSTLFSFWKRSQWGRLGLSLLWLLLFLITGKFWYGGLFGRYSALIGYLFGLLSGLTSKKKLAYWLLIVCLLANFIPTFIAYQKTPIPLLQAELIKKTKINTNDLLVMSDYQRPQLPYPNALFINGDLNLQKTIEKQIDQSFTLGQRVFITQQAVSFPYFQYDGQQLHIISSGDKNKAVINNYLKNKQLKLVIEDKNYPLLKIYEILNLKP